MDLGRKWGVQMSMKGLVAVVGIVALAVLVGVIHRTAQRGANSDGAARAPAPAVRTITRDGYGSRWPFVRLTATMECLSTDAGNLPIVRLGEMRFALTGATSAKLKLPVVGDAEWLDVAPGAGKVSLDAVRRDAFAFCDPPAPMNPYRN